MLIGILRWAMVRKMALMRPWEIFKSHPMPVQARIWPEFVRVLCKDDAVPKIDDDDEALHYITGRSYYKEKSRHPGISKSMRISIEEFSSKGRIKDWMRIIESSIRFEELNESEKFIFIRLLSLYPGLYFSRAYSPLMSC